ncbi:NADH dehydrogenase subunit 4L, mitochondrion (chloroplast) [Artemisia annua]|uniref:NADH dehydrogenase subunit 4L, mitochondrion n=1 Tax=Artemisia annua TaxID=35608 RepID=A0A2U1NEC2_ARTAN|nr:NADH dehydrogenase subunit 4L, mitochondrion [Artemisia annua]
MMGQSFASLVPTVAAAESAIGLAIFVITFRVRGTIAVESINSIQDLQKSEWEEEKEILRLGLLSVARLGGQRALGCGGAIIGLGPGRGEWPSGQKRRTGIL